MVISLVFKATALLGVVILAQGVMTRRASASTRHLIWVSTLVALLALPVVTQMLPRWPVTVPVAAPSHPTSIGPIAESADSHLPPVVSSSVASPIPSERDKEQRIDPYAVAAWIYAIGVVAVIVYGLGSRWQLRRFRRRSAILDDEDWTRLFSESKRAMRLSRPVALLKSRERNVPLAAGTRRPAVIVPAIADTWDENRRRAVLLHELAHIARFDCLTDAITFVVCAVYWFHPGVWWIARRARIERELACDDRVINAGTEAREYATHLLEIAYSFGGRRAPALAVCMARPRQLEGRMLAALDANRNRRLPSLQMRIIFAAVAGILLLLVSTVTFTVDAAAPIDPGVAAAWPASRDPQRSSTGAKSASDDQQLETLRARQLKSWWDTKPLADSKPLWDRPAVRTAVASLAAAAQASVPGTWEIRPADAQGMVHLRITELNSSSGTNVPVDQLEGLTGAQLTGVGGPVQFKVRRDAGTFTFEGIIRNGVGAGTFSFAADPSFPDAMVKRGFARPTSTEQYQMARHDIGFAFIDELTKQGYGKPQTSDLVRAGQHGVRADYLRDMAALGYRLGTLDALITLRDHGVTAAYVRELADNGYRGLSADGIREARDHGITTDYVRGMRDAGFGSVSMEELIKARDHGVTVEYVRGLGDAGYKKLPLDQLIRVRDHGVTTEYVREMRQLGYTLSIDDLVRARDHGVTLEYVREMSSLGYGGQPIDSLIRVRDHGVSAEYAKDVKALGYDKLTLEDLVTLRDHGLTAERIRSANSRAGTRLPIDMLKSLAAGGLR